jgi:hypothetical protein
MKLIGSLFSLPLLLVCNTTFQTRKRLVGGDCDGCDLIYEGMPNNASWETRVSKDNEDVPQPRQ